MARSINYAVAGRWILVAVTMILVQEDQTQAQTDSSRSYFPATTLEIASTGVAYRDGREPVVTIELTEQGRLAWWDFTTTHVNKTVELLVGDRVIMAPRVNEPITGGRLMLYGDLSGAQAAELARALKARELPLAARLRTTTP